MKNSFHRLGFAASLVALTLGVAGCQCCRTTSTTSAPMSEGAAAASPSTKESQSAITPQQALAELRAGNARFVAGQPRVRHPLADVHASAPGQYPFAVVLSCIDSRQPVETVLDQGIGDIFCARVAGNVLNEDVLGSMEFGCKVAGAKLIVVIGHSNCGAIKGAIDNVELGNLTSLLAKIKPAIDKIPADAQPRTSKNHDLVEHVAEANVRLVMAQIRERSPVLREMLDQGRIGLAGGLYDLDTGKVHFFEH